MAFYRPYLCPDCGGKFRYLHHPNDAPPPDECQLCGASMVDPAPVFEPAAPAIGTYKGKSPDQVYRQMETASEARTELMAQHVPGASASDFSHTKVTDLHDNLREGDIAAKYSAPPNYVQEFMKLNPAPGGGSAVGGYTPIVAGATPIEYAAQTRTGPFPYAGAQTADRIKANHAQLARIVQREGQENKH